MQNLETSPDGVLDSDCAVDSVEKSCPRSSVTASDAVDGLTYSTCDQQVCPGKPSFCVVLSCAARRRFNGEGAAMCVKGLRPNQFGGGLSVASGGN